MSSPYGWVVTFAYTGKRGCPNSIFVRYSVSGAELAATIDEWNAEATGSRTAVHPADFAAVAAHAMSASCPASTTWRGALSLAITNAAARCGSVSSIPRTSSALAVTASIAPS